MPAGDQPNPVPRLVITMVLGVGLLVLGLFILLRRSDQPRRTFPPGPAPSVLTTQPGDASPIETSESATRALTSSQAGTTGDAYVPPGAQNLPVPAPQAAAAASAHVAFVPNGKLLIAAADGKLEFCDVVTGQRQAVGASVGGAALAMNRSADGRTIITCDAGGNVGLFETSAFGRTNSIRVNVPGVVAVALAADGRTIALAGSGGVVVWDIAGGKPLCKLANENAASVDFSSDGHLLATAGTAGVSLWDTTFWRKQGTLGGGGARIVRFWPARAAVVVVGADRAIRIYDLPTRQVQTTLAGEGETIDIAVSPDARTIVTSGPGGLTVWDSTTRSAHHLP